MMDFSAGAGMSSPNSLIPADQLCWVILNVRGVKNSQSGGRYIDLELTVDEGQPFARKKLWEMVGDPMHMGNSEAYRQMGMVAISRILEAACNAGPHNPAGYSLRDYSDLSGLRVPVRIGVQKGQNGYEDKNRVAEWLTPNPNSQSGHKEFLLLQQGILNKKQGQPGAVPPAATPQTGFGQPSFSQPQPQGAPVQTAASGFPPAQSAPTATSPSNQPSWLAQANGQ